MLSNVHHRIIAASVRLLRARADQQEPKKEEHHVGREASDNDLPKCFHFDIRGMVFICDLSDRGSGWQGSRPLTAAFGVSLFPYWPRHPVPTADIIIRPYPPCMQMHTYP